MKLSDRIAIYLWFVYLGAGGGFICSPDSVHNYKHVFAWRIALMVSYAVTATMGWFSWRGLRREVKLKEAAWRRI